MSGVGTHELAAKARTTRGQTPGLRAQIAHDWAAAKGYEIRGDCLDGMEQLWRVVLRLRRKPGGRVDFTYRELVRELGWPTDGTVNGARPYKRIIKLRLGYFQDLRWLEDRHPEWESNGEGRCIVVRLSPRSSVDKAPGSRTRPHTSSQEPSRRGAGESEPHFFSGEVTPPSRESVVVSAVDVASKQFSPSRSLNGGASARIPGPFVEGARERRSTHAARSRREIRAAIAIGVTVQHWGIERGGSRLAADPAVLEAPPTTVARLLFQAALPDVKPLISAERQAQLEAATRRLNHYGYGGPGSWISVACRVLAGWQEGELGWCSEPPRSLGALALELKREANCWRHSALERRSVRLRPLAAARARQAVKHWRAENRRSTRLLGRYGMITRPGSPARDV